MTIPRKLASLLKLRDEVPNELLAEEIVRANNRSAVKELVENVNKKNRDIQSDCVKVLYEIGDRKPVPNVGLAEEFASLLERSNRRWINQLPMNAEVSAGIVNNRNKEAFNRIVETHGQSLEKESQRKRVAGVLEKVMA